MATLTNRRIKDTVGDLFHIENENAGIADTTTTKYHQVEDGAGVKTPMRVSKEAIQFGGTSNDGGYGIQAVVLTGSVTGAVATEMFLDGVSKTLVIPAGYQFIYDGFVHVTRTDSVAPSANADGSFYRAQLRGGSCVHVDGQLFIDQPSWVEGKGSATIPQPTITAGGSGDSTYLKIEVTGTASQTKKIAIYLRGAFIPYVDDPDTIYKHTDSFQSSDIAGSDYFGFSTAMSGDGNYLAVQAPLEDEGGTDAGAIYIFKDINDDGTWTEMQKIVVSGSVYLGNYYWDTTWDYHMNKGIALDEDGDTLVIGNRRDGGNAGAIFVFTRSGETWTQEQAITSSVSETNSIFGSSVDISNDGDVIVVGHPWADDGTTDAGLAYIFRRNTSTWTEEQKIQASDRAASDYFGWDVAINGAGTEVAITAISDDDTQTNAGAVYTFTESSNTWTEQQKFQSSNAATQDHLGFTVAFAKNTDTLVVSAGFYDSTLYSNAVYVFTKSGTWSEQAVLTPIENLAVGQHTSLAIAEDGNTIVMGAPYEDSYGTDQGAAWVFTRSGSTWTEKQKLRANPIAGQTQMWFNACSISGDAMKIVVGGQFADTTTTNAGEAYAWRRADAGGDE